MVFSIGLRISTQNAHRQWIVENAALLQELMRCPVRGRR